MTTFEFVDPGDDGVLTRALSGRPVIGLDTEFMREKTYFAQLCLIQIATVDKIYCVDPMGEADLQPFWTKLMNCSWVLHSGRQDMEVLYASARTMPESVFDTQIAAALLGYQPQIGYANLVAELCGVHLAKSHTRADWSQRPLPGSVIEYAVEDAAFLLEMHDLLRDRLERLDRLAWAEEDSAELLDVNLYTFDASAAVERLKGARNLRGKARAVADGLARWREKEAVRLNRPRQWILRDAVLLELAATCPQSASELAATAGLPRRSAERYSGQFLEIIAESVRRGSNYRPPPRPNEADRARLKAAQALVVARAGELGVAPEVLASKKEISAALLGESQSRLFSGWRNELLGDELRAAFASV